jgi:ABC-2 type transport system ATP-binding protein
MAEAPAILLDDLRKSYGNFEAVRGLNVTVRPGEIYSFLGANGAGKTTTMKMIVGILPPTAGRVAIMGHDVWKRPAEAKRLIGYVPDTPILHELLTGQEFLWFMSDLYGLSRSEGKQRAAQLLQFLGLTAAADKLIRDFSLGMKRKMAIATALLNRPPVLLLDEVTNGLDARAAREVKDLIVRLAKSEGTAVFLTTHILAIPEEMADRIGLIHKGVIVAEGTMAELQTVAERPGSNLEELFLHFTGEQLDHEEATTGV